MFRVSRLSSLQGKSLEYMRFVAMTLLAATTASAAADSSFLKEYASTRRYLAGRPVNPKVTPDGKAVLFLRAKPNAPEQTLFELEVATGAVRELLTPEAVLNGAAQTLTAAEKAELERKRVTARGFTTYQLSKDGAKTLLSLSGKLYVVERQSGKVTQLKVGPGAPLDARFSPDGSLVSYVRNHDVHAVELKANVERQLTKGGSERTPHGLAEFVAQEEMSRFSGYWWSGDGKHLAFQETDHAGVEQLRVFDPLKPEAEPDTFFYPRAGRPNAAVRLGVTSAAGGKVTWVEWDQKAYPYLATVKWPKAAPLTLVVQNREQTKLQVLAADAATGKTTLLLEETDPAWLNLNQEFPHWVGDGSGFLWGTEANGSLEVQLLSRDGKTKSSWVGPDVGYADFIGFDDAKKLLYFVGGLDPTQAIAYRAAQGQKPERLTSDEVGPAVQGGVLSDDGGVVVLTSTTLQHLPRTAVFTTDGKRVGELPSVAVEPKLSLNLELKQVGELKLNAAVIRPHGYKPGVKLPVVLQVYGGPGHLEVLHSLRENLLLQWLADQGFVVVKLDGRGTPRRGRDFERAIKGDFATVVMADQLAGLKGLAAQVPEMNLERVGIFGWSFGGYLSALMTLAQGDIIKSGVAGAPVVDWHDYDTHYTERYLGVPPQAEAAYQVSSVLTYVERAKRPLLLMHGTADDNVYFLHTLKLSDALFRAGKPHQVLPLSNFTHMVPEPLVLQRQWERIAQHFKDTL